MQFILNPLPLLLVGGEVAPRPFLEAWEDPIMKPPLDGCFVLLVSCLLV